MHPVGRINFWTLQGSDFRNRETSEILCIQKKILKTKICQYSYVLADDIWEFPQLSFYWSSNYHLCNSTFSSWCFQTIWKRRAKTEIFPKYIEVKINKIFETTTQFSWAPDVKNKKTQRSFAAVTDLPGYLPLQRAPGKCSEFSPLRVQSATRHVMKNAYDKNISLIRKTPVTLWYMFRNLHKICFKKCINLRFKLRRFLKIISVLKKINRGRDSMQ